MLYIETERLILRSADPRDAEILSKYRESEFVQKYNAMTPKTVEQMRVSLEHDMKNERAAYIVEKATGTPVGGIWWQNDDMRWKVNSVTTECWLGEPHAHKGYMTEAYRAIIPYIFERGAYMISSRVFADNAASRKMFENLGFVNEGVLRDAVLGWGDILHDDAIYSLKKGEYMDLSPLSVEELRRVYYTDMVYQFPSDELKSCEGIVALMSEGFMDAFGAFINGEMTGYIISAVSGNARFLQYVAVKKEFHSRGYGSRMMRMYLEKFHGADCVLCDIESASLADNDEERRQCLRRKRFYERLGFADTGVRAKMFGVGYDIMAFPIAFARSARNIIDITNAFYAKLLADDMPNDYGVRTDGQG